MEMTARVLQAGNDGTVWVRAIPVGDACGSCSSHGQQTANSGGGCGVDNIGRMFAGKEQRYRVLDTLGCHPGDEVVIGINDGSVLRGSAAVYLLPLALLFIGAVLAAHQSTPAHADLASVAGAVGGFALATVWLWRFNLRIKRDPRFQPVILRKVHPGRIHLKELTS